MAWNRLYLKNYIKSSQGLARGREDGLLTDALIEEAIEDAIETVADDCRLLPVTKKLAVEAGKWEYPMPDDVLSIRHIKFIDSGGTYLPVGYISQETFQEYRDPATDTNETPWYYCYPVYQRQAFMFHVQAPPVYDYIARSYITESTVRTLVDTGIDFGKTLDGRRVKPKCVVHNLTDDSYGYVEALGIKTNITTGTATSGTSTTKLEDTGKDFTALGVEEGNIICTPSTGIVTGYAFVTAVGTTTVTYADFQSTNNAKRFGVDDTYKIGKAQEIRLSLATPHPGLRTGATNLFTLSAAKATMTGTTFTATTCTGSSTSGAEAGDIGIASGGSHGTVSGVETSSITVDYWVGGIPSAGETVVIKESQQYQVEGELRTERVLWLGPTPSSSDAVGSESIIIAYNARPTMPSNDSDTLEVPEKYKEILKKCLRWKAIDLMGTRSAEELETLEVLYRRDILLYAGDIWAPPTTESPNVLRNRAGRGRRTKYTTPDGIRWNPM